VGALSRRAPARAGLQLNKMNIFRLHNALFSLGLALVTFVMLGGCGGEGSTPNRTFTGSFIGQLGTVDRVNIQSMEVTIDSQGSVTGQTIVEPATPDVVPVSGHIDNGGRMVLDWGKNHMTAIVQFVASDRGGGANLFAAGSAYLNDSPTQLSFELWKPQQ